jgi:tRNA-2-methylthio-N6-dimethylallyladenosine synthase
MNKAESQSILLALQDDGWTEADTEDAADLVILNTCSVRETAEERIRGRLGHYRHAKGLRPFTLVLTGCMAERLKERLIDEHPEIDVVVGTFSKKDLPTAVARSMARRSAVVSADEREYAFAPLHSTGGLKAFVPIMHGCNNHCSYCIVPSVRGPEVSRSPETILEELRRLSEAGTREVTLLGQNVNSYCWAGGALTFPGLLDRVATTPGSLRWVRFLTSHPKDLSDELLDVMASSAMFCRHVHLPLQSGSTRILGLMNRKYTADQYLSCVQRIRRALSGVAITTDILIGFPGETEDEVRQTLGLMEEVGFDDAFLYFYNPRAGTPACEMPGALSDEVKHERLERVIDAQRAIGRRRAEERLGREVEVLVEGVSKKSPGELLGRTEWDAMAVFPGERSLVGEFSRVRLDSLSGTTFKASLR